MTRLFKIFPAIPVKAVVPADLDLASLQDTQTTEEFALAEKIDGRFTTAINLLVQLKPSFEVPSACH